MNSTSPLKPHIYRYSAWRTLGGNYLTIVLASSAVFILSHVLRQLLLPATEPILLLVATFAALMLMVAANVALFNSTILVDQSGITTQIAGMKTKTISWKDTERFERFSMRGNISNYIEVFRSMGEYQGKLGYFFPNTLGYIAFTNKIENHKGLIEQLNHYARKHGIPQYVKDENDFEIRVEKF